MVMPNSCLVCDCFHTIKAELSSYDRNLWATKLKILTYLSLYRKKKMSTLKLEHSGHALSYHHSWSFEFRKMWSFKGDLNQHRKK